MLELRMADQIVPAFIALFGFGWSALADDASLPALPTFAQSPQSNPESPNPWSGLVVGSEVFVLSLEKFGVSPPAISASLLE
jgi:hypothetical protein